MLPLIFKEKLGLRTNKIYDGSNEFSFLKKKCEIRTKLVITITLESVVDAYLNIYVLSTLPILPCTSI